MSEIASSQDEREAQEAKLRVEELRSQVNYHDYRYQPGSIVVAAAGNLEHERLEDLARGLMNPSQNGAAAPSKRCPCSMNKSHGAASQLCHG